MQQNRRFFMVVIICWKRDKTINYFLSMGYIQNFSVYAKVDQTPIKGLRVHQIHKLKVSIFSSSVLWDVFWGNRFLYYL